MATRRQIAANRRNARRSTGPRTPEGKARVAQNSATHGLYSKTNVLISIGETEAEYQACLHYQTQQSRPHDAGELALVETMAACMWKRERAWNLDGIAWQIPDKFAAIRLLDAASIADTHAINLYNKAEDDLFRLQDAKIRSKPNFEQPTAKSLDYKEN
jgi:hypothetical protein